MVRAVEQCNPDIDHWEACIGPFSEGLQSAFLNSRDVVLRDGSAEDLVNELKFLVGQRFHLEDDMTVLTSASGLLLVLALSL